VYDADDDDDEGSVCYSVIVAVARVFFVCLINVKDFVHWPALTIRRNQLSSSAPVVHL